MHILVYNTLKLWFFCIVFIFLGFLFFGLFSFLQDFIFVFLLMQFEYNILRYRVFIFFGICPAWYSLSWVCSLSLVLENS